jgi:hypothetical protein
LDPFWMDWYHQISSTKFWENGEKGPKVNAYCEDLFNALEK